MGHDTVCSAQWEYGEHNIGNDSCNVNIFSMGRMKYVLCVCVSVRRITAICTQSAPVQRHDSPERATISPATCLSLTN